MASYQLEIIVKENKFEELIDSLIDISSEIRGEEGCINFSLYRDLEKRDAYRVLGEWTTRQTMEQHFKKKSFKVLIGAARVLGKAFEMSIGETLEKGSYPLARKKIKLCYETGKTMDIKS